MRTASLLLLCGTKGVFDFLVPVRIRCWHFFAFVLGVYRLCLCESYMCPRKLEEGVGSSGARVKGSCELPVVSARNQTSNLTWERAGIAPNH